MLGSAALQGDHQLLIRIGSGGGPSGEFQQGAMREFAQRGSLLATGCRMPEVLGPG